MRIPAKLRVTVLALAGLLCLLAIAWAEQTMTFRPVARESAATLQRQRLEARRAGAERTRDQVRAELQAERDAAKAAIAAHPAVPQDASADALTDSVGIPAIPEAPEVPRTTTGEIVRFGSDITVPADQLVQGDVVSIGGDVTVHGKVAGSVTSVGGDVDLRPGARVDEDVVCIGGTLREAPGSSIGGQRVTAPRGRRAGYAWPMAAVVGSSVGMIVHLFQLLVLAGLAWLIIKLAPSRTQEAIDTLKREAGTSVLLGLLVWGMLIPSVVALALVVALLCITIIGIPVAIAVLVAYVALMVVLVVWGSVVGYAMLGQRLHQQFKGAPATLLASAMWGLVAMYGLRLISDMFHFVPVFGLLGGMIKFVAIAGSALLMTFGAGALVRSEYNRRTVQNWWKRARPGPVKRDDPTGPGAPPPAPGGDSPPMLQT